MSDLNMNSRASHCLGGQNSLEDNMIEWDERKVILVIKFSQGPRFLKTSESNAKEQVGRAVFETSNKIP